jgi:hypothetical protein
MLPEIKAWPEERGGFSPQPNKESFASPNETSTLFELETCRGFRRTVEASLCVLCA